MRVISWHDFFSTEGGQGVLRWWCNIVKSGAVPRGNVCLMSSLIVMLWTISRRLSLYSTWNIACRTANTSRALWIQTNTNEYIVTLMNTNEYKRIHCKLREYIVFILSYQCYVIIGNYNNNDDQLGVCGKRGCVMTCKAGDEVSKFWRWEILQWVEFVEVIREVSKDWRQFVNIMTVWIILQKCEKICREYNLLILCALSVLCKICMKYYAEMIR